MQLFYEADEIVPEMEEAETIRAEITGKTEAEAAEILAVVKAIMGSLTYRLVLHTCKHEEGLPCIEVEI